MNGDQERRLQEILAEWPYVQGPSEYCETRREILQERLYKLIGEIEDKAYDQGIDKVHEGWTGL